MATYQENNQAGGPGNISYANNGGNMGPMPPPPRYEIDPMETNGADWNGGMGGRGMPTPPGSDGYDGYNYDQYTSTGGYGGGSGGAWQDGYNPVEKNSYGGQRIAGSDPSAADYDSVRQYSDAAYEDARRYLDPEQAFDGRRFEQSMINKGIDPQSAMGQKMYSDMMRAHGDQDSGAAFDSMQFGQGIQNQMAGQEFQKSSLAGDMQRALWENQRGKYNSDQQYDIANQGLGIQRQSNDWNQMIDLDSIDFRNRGYADNEQKYLDQLIMAQDGMNPVPAGSTIDPDGSQTRNGWDWGYNQNQYY